MVRTAAIAMIAAGAGAVAAPSLPLALPLSLTLQLPAAPSTVAPTALVARPASTSSRLRLTRAADGLFHAPVSIDGRHATLVVDTGATVTVFTAADAARLGIEASRGADDALLRTAGGAAPMRWATVRTLRIAGRDHADLDVAVVADGLEHSLLGQDVLGAGGVLRVEGDAMELS